MSMHRLTDAICSALIRDMMPMNYFVHCRTFGPWAGIIWCSQYWFASHLNSGAMIHLVCNKSHPTSILFLTVYMQMVGHLSECSRNGISYQSSKTRSVYSYSTTVEAASGQWFRTRSMAQIGSAAATISSGIDASRNSTGMSTTPIFTQVHINARSSTLRKSRREARENRWFWFGRTWSLSGLSQRLSHHGRLRMVQHTFPSTRITPSYHSSKTKWRGNLESWWTGRSGWGGRMREVLGRTRQMPKRSWCRWQVVEEMSGSSYRAPGIYILWMFYVSCSIAC